MLADGRQTRDAVFAVRDHVDALKAEADKEHSKMWAAIHGLKAALKKKPTKLMTVSNNKLVLVLVGAAIPAAASAYAVKVSTNAEAALSAAKPVVIQSAQQSSANCEVLRDLTHQRLKSLEHNFRATIRDPKKSAAQKDDARDYYIAAVKRLPAVKC